jgi:hypothetical protein
MVTDKQALAAIDALIVKAEACLAALAQQPKK